MKENNFFSENRLKGINELDKFSQNQIQEDPLQEEYEKYRKSLIYYKECPACHYVQGMVFLGISFFSAVRLQFIWSSLKWSGVLKYSFITMIFSTVAVYKITYAYHVFQAQGKLNKKT